MTFQLQNAFTPSQILPQRHGEQLFLRAKRFDDPPPGGVDFWDLWVSSGIAIVHRQGDPDVSERWRYADLVLRIGPIWEGPLIDCSPSISLASIGNQGAATNAGWAVDDVQWRAHGVFVEGQPRSQIQVESRLAVRDTDGGLFRVAFHITAYGTVLRPVRYSDAF